MAAPLHQHRRQLAPGPKGIFGGLGHVQRDPLPFLTRVQRQYGDIVCLRGVGPFRWYFLTNPAAVEHVLRGDYGNYPKGLFSFLTSLVAGNGLLSSDGETWLQQRRLMQPAFHREEIAGLGVAMADASTALADRWAVLARTNEPVNVSAEMTRLTLQIVGRTLFSIDLGGEADAIGPALTTVLEHMNYRSNHPFVPPERYPTPRNRRYHRAMHTIDHIVQSIIDQRRRTHADGSDLLGMLLAARDEATGEGMSDAQLRDEVRTLVLAGHETTANALSWTWYLLAQHPHAEEQLHVELDRVLGGRHPTVADLPQLPYTRMVLDEALRLYPPVWMLGRQARTDGEIRGYHIPAGTVIGIGTYVMHRDPSLWPDPDRFEPARWQDERSHGRHRFAYLPFGGGPRQCIGNTFALMEAQIILATLAQRFRLRLAPGAVVTPEIVSVMRPKYGVQVTLDAR